MSSTLKYSPNNIQEIVDGLNKLSCGNHSCYFNPPKGMGTNGGCTCLGRLPLPLQIALRKLHIANKENNDNSSNY